MSDTPETDAAWAVESGNGLNEVKEISRKLERERDEALMDRANGDIATMTINHYERILRERDEAREKYDTLATEHMLAVNKLCKERDDAQAEIQRLRFNAQREAEHHDRMIGELEKVYTERDDALGKVKELIYIADRAIALADIDFDNDKFGVVSELRSDLEKIKKSK